MGRAGALVVLLAGLVGSVAGYGWLQTRAYLGAGPAVGAQAPPDDACALFVGPRPGTLRSCPPVPGPSQSVAAERPVGEMAVISTPPAGWEGRPRQYGAGLSLANP